MLRIFRKNSAAYLGGDNHYTGFEEGEPIALAGVIRDITTIKAAEEQIADLQKSKEVFLSYISHELKTPITSFCLCNGFER